MAERTAFNPDWVVAPGESLRECLDAQGFDVEDYARGTGGWLFGITREEMKGMLAGTQTIDAVLANKLQRLTGVNERMWLALEHNFRAGLAAGKTWSGAHECTGLTASWCPEHGDCTCPRKPDGEPIPAEEGGFDLSAPGCPLHDPESAHGK